MDTQAIILDAARCLIGGYALVFDRPGYGLDWSKWSAFTWKAGELPVNWCHERLLGRALALERDSVGVKITAELFDPALLVIVKYRIAGWSVSLASAEITGNYLHAGEINEISLSCCQACPPTPESMTAMKQALEAFDPADLPAPGQRERTAGGKCCMLGGPPRILPPYFTKVLK